MTEYDWMWLHITDYDWIWPHMTKYDWISLNVTMTEYGWIWLNVTEYDWLWRIWLNMTKVVDLCKYIVKYI